VAGVVSDVRYREWEAVRPDLYVPYTQRAQHRSDFVIKTHGDPASLVSAVRREVMELDKDQAISNVTTMAALVDRALARSRFNSIVLGTLAACALVLTVIGLYGVLSYMVAQRRGEIGLRMAVGASPWQMVRMVTLGGLRLTACGTLIGAAAAWALSRLYVSLLFGVSPLDPLTYAGTAVVLLAVAVLACAVPAIQAARLDPLRTLQSN
jgi:ABC-type antimicrobial peptide transport system permease subunit